MARPRQNNAEYFSHDADMRNDVRIKALRRKFKHEGYSIWNMLLEYLTDCNYFEFECTEINIELIAADFDIDVKSLNEIINYLIKLNLIQKVNNIINCRKHIERFSGLIGKRDKGRENYNNSEFLQQKLQNNDISETETTQSKVKYSKVNENKVNEVTDKNNFSENFKIPTKNEVVNFFKENGYNLEAAKLFYLWANGLDWINEKTGKNLKWKSVCVGWFKPEYKIESEATESLIYKGSIFSGTMNKDGSINP